MIFRHRLFTSSIKLKIKQFHIVVVRKLQRNVQKKKVCYTCKAVVLPTKPIIVVVVVVCLRCFLTLSLPLRRRIFKSLSIWDATGRRMHLFSTYSSADFSACSPKAKKEHLIAGLSNRWHVFIPCPDSGKYSGFGQKMSKERLCLKKI